MLDQSEAARPSGAASSDEDGGALTASCAGANEAIVTMQSVAENHDNRWERTISGLSFGMRQQRACGLDQVPCPA
jgi:hypothetical protein